MKAIRIPERAWIPAALFAKQTCGESEGRRLVQAARRGRQTGLRTTLLCTMNTLRTISPHLFLSLAFITFVFPLCAKEASSYEQAVAAYRERRLEQAFLYARDAVSHDPEDVDALVLLGHLYYSRQELHKAKECWEKALKLAPSRSDIQPILAQLKKELPLEEILKHSGTEPFVVRFAEGESPVNLGELRRILQTVYRLEGQQFGYFPNYPIPVILYPETDFEKVKGISHRVAGLYDGKIRLPIRKADLGTAISPSVHLEGVLWHEYAHILVYDLSKGQCPLWLNEGIAVVQQTRVNHMEVEDFKEAFQAKQLPSWQQLFSEQQYPEDSFLHARYEYAYMVTSYLIKKAGWPRCMHLLKKIGQGIPFPDAFQAEYKTTLPALEKKWREWIAKQL